MKITLLRSLLIFSFLCGIAPLELSAQEKETLRVLSWEGYVNAEDLSAVNQLLEEQGYPYEVKVITPLAEGAEQMFNLIRSGHADITFLTLFFIKMENEQTSKILQAINIDSPRLSNYKHLLTNLTHIPMGLAKHQGLSSQGRPLYIPWGGGIYGFYANHNRIDKSEVPKSIKELWLPKWHKRFSLNKSQSWYNVGLALMNLEKSPFYLHELVKNSQRDLIISTMSANSALQKQLNSLYANAGDLWGATPKFSPELAIVSSWGPEITRKNRSGGNWQLINFEEGHMVWLDTINFVKGLEGKKLEAAEIFANYFIGEKVQSRVAKDLSMVAASSLAQENGELGNATTLFNDKMFVPPYDGISYSIIKRMTDIALTHH